MRPILCQKIDGASSIIAKNTTTMVVRKTWILYFQFKTIFESIFDLNT